MRCPHCNSDKIASAKSSIGESVANWTEQAWHCKQCGAFFDTAAATKELPVAPLPGTVPEDL